MQLSADFADLEPSSSPDTFNAVRLTPARRDFLGKDQRGAPVFLVADDSEPVYRPIVQHCHLSAEFCMLCRLNVDGAEVIGRFALIRLEDATPELHELFIRCVCAAIADLPPSVQTADIEARVNRLLELFRNLSRPAGREISGLWAELFCIIASGDILVAIDRWHTNNTESFDFSWTRGRLEVKSTVGAFRIHDFALEQLQPSSDGSGYVASLILKSTNGGEGVLDLARQIEGQLQGQHHLQSKLWSVLVQSLGADFSEALDRKFDVHLAGKQLMLFRMEDIPALPPCADARISSIKFKADLSAVQSSIGVNGETALRALF